jgi:hypothetical protein
LINVKPITAQEKLNFPRANAILARAQALLWVREWVQGYSNLFIYTILGWMADQDHPPKPKTPTEDDDRSEARTSVDDARALGPDFPRENIQINANQQKKEDRNVGGSGQAESESEQIKPTYNHISHECRNGESELVKKGNNAENSKVVTSRESQEINDKRSGTVQGENDQKGSQQVQRNRSQEETKEMKHSNPVEYGSGGQRNSVGDHGVGLIGQGKFTFTVTEENTQKSYSQAARTLGNTQRSNSQAADTPANTQRNNSHAAGTSGNTQRSYSYAADTPGNTQKSYSQAARTLGNTQRSNSQAADTPGNTQKSYSQAVRTQGNAQRSCAEQKPYSIPPPTSTKVRNT